MRIAGRHERERENNKINNENTKGRKIDDDDR